MATIDTGGGGGRGRRALDADINMVPMIDLLMVTISFLLITAVWVHSQRLTATGQGPSSAAPHPCEGAECAEEARLHVETRDPAKFVLVWRRGATVLSTAEVPRGERQTRFPELARRIGDEWRTQGQHQAPDDRRFDHAVVHAANDMAYRDIVAVLDAVAAPKRAYVASGGTVEANAFDVTFATD